MEFIIKSDKNAERPPVNEPLPQLTDLQLALVGGGIGDIVGH